MAYTYKSNVAKIKADNTVNLSLALRFMIEDIDRKAFPKTPKDKGNLRQDVLKTVLGKSAFIVWNKEYAAAQEDGTTRGFPIANYTTPGTGAHYAESSVKDVVENSQDYFKKAKLI